MRVDGITIGAFAIGVVVAVLVNSFLWDFPSRAGLTSGPWPLKA